MDNIEQRKMELNRTQAQHLGYEPISDKSTDPQYKKGTKYTILKIGCYLLAVLNLLTSLCIIGMSVFLVGVKSIIFAFYGTSRESILFGAIIIHGILFTAATVTWIVMIGCFIRSLVKRKRFRSPKILCKQMLHTSAVWMTILRIILGSTICALESTNIPERFYIHAFVMLLIEYAVNMIFMLCYYWYAVKLDFGLISDVAEESGRPSLFLDEFHEKPRPICVDEIGLGVSAGSEHDLS